jgi:prepilin-type N-terminal cleavage/methylation domain-containing protein
MTNTISAINVLKAKKNKKGFTLMEMLIVVAIIAILVAIAIPVFSTQLNSAKEQVDAANLRSAESMAVADYYLSGDTDGATYVAINKDNNTMAVSTSATTGYYPSKAHGTQHIEVVIAADGSVTSALWK